jgi:hypothetical protein
VSGTVGTTVDPKTGTKQTGRGAPAARSRRGVLGAKVVATLALVMGLGAGVALSGGASGTGAAPAGPGAHSTAHTSAHAVLAAPANDWWWGN